MSVEGELSMEWAAELISYIGVCSVAHAEQVKILEQGAACCRACWVCHLCKSGAQLLQL